MSESARLRLKIAGWNTSDEMEVDPGIWHCGPITDGVSIWFKGNPGGFVLDFRDLERLYVEAKRQRSSLP